MWGDNEEVIKEFIKWSKIGYNEREKKSRREYWDEAKVSRFVNPCKVFLQNCTEPLEGVCRFNEQRLSISGIFGQNIAMAELTSEWLKPFVKISPIITKKEELYIWDFKESV